ncbi:phosphate signaling complex protein PhoU [Megasphaera vaginalis (ex Srinivasan et al. 2021)]|uniref:Phosphate-specific transport system accessory protein PhoU n=1 Tax=Megasphaera vaginalis (ex Srinivasan et al. 2021) TaxID=1111454 RepID=U7UML4_9FIRM|nr:phosphate signaling complex protein PhoU [Megasphaera vaginalis (ex Srinivasan et al. 2021)]ERT60556.1 phosphate transport system regulatory protein PhoU [Megasphaera vaginalis (ex Srinivasan et al. 2021)]
MLEVYELKIKEFEEKINQLSAAIETAVDKTWEGIESMDEKIADEVYRGDDLIDSLVRDCMKEDMTISLMQSPVAADWRKLMATFKILSDLERIADHCADISHYVLHLKRFPPVPQPPSQLKEMYDVMRAMVRESIAMYKGEGQERAELMKDRDDIVDTTFSNSVEEISRYLTETPDYAHQYVDYLSIIKYIERMADHANNIAEWVIYRERNEILA